MSMLFSPEKFGLVLTLNEDDVIACSETGNHPLP